MTSQRFPLFDLSGGIQQGTSWLLRKANEVEDAINGRFNKVIGSVVRRLGYTSQGGALEVDKSALGFFEAKFTAGAKLLAAINSSDDSETTIKIYDSSGETWSDLSLPNTLDADTEVQFAGSLGETYIAGKSDDTYMALLNMKDASTVSATRNLINAPKAKYITEFGGSLYAMNVEVGTTVYSDRAYKSSPAMGIVTFTQGDQSVFNTFKVDTVRYLKASMDIDIYTAGTATKTHDISITSVNNSTNEITYSGTTTNTFTSSNVNTSTDVITITSNLATGTPVKVAAGGTIPTGLTAGVIYYVINVSSTTIKLALSHDDAVAGTAIDITGAGSGTNTLTIGTYIPDNTEVWLDGRHGELCYLWNTDYPTAETADFLRIPPGIDSNSEITAWSKSNSRLFLFTKNSAYKWDGANLVTVYEDIGCPNIQTIQNIGTWLIWLDAEGNVRARDDSSGQDEIISTAVKPLIDQVTDFTTAAAGRINNVYKLCLGTVNDKTLRLCYDFTTNTWEHDEYTLNMTRHVRSDMSGTMRLYFIGDDGQMYLDEEGNLDDAATIPFSVTFGRFNMTTEQSKNIHGVFVFGENVTGANVKAALDGTSDFKDFGELNGAVTKILFSSVRGQFSGRDVNVIVSMNSEGESPKLDGIVYYYSQEEDKFGNAN